MKAFFAFLLSVNCSISQLCGLEDIDYRSYSFCGAEFDHLESEDFFIPDDNLDEHEKCWRRTSNSFCYRHSYAELFPLVEKDLLSSLPTLSEYKCTCCDHGANYLGYTDPRFKRYHAHVKRQLRFSQQYRECSCYWPERSIRAAEIMRNAYDLFQRLFHSTAFLYMALDDGLIDEFRNTAFSDCTLDSLISYSIGRQFRFSHYHRFVSDLKDFSEKHFSEDQVIEIKNNLKTILKELATLFVPHYEKCYKKHPNEEIAAELEFAKLFLPENEDIPSELDSEDAEDYVTWEEEIEEFVNKRKEDREYGYPGYPTKINRLAFLNVAPIFVVDWGYPRFPGQAESCKKILKNLVNELYKDYEFFKELNEKNKNLGEELVDSLIYAAKDQITSGERLTNARDVTTARDLRAFDIRDNELRYFFYNVENGWDWTMKHTKIDDRFCLTSFLTIRKKTDYLASIWLAPKPLLMALFQDENVVEDIANTRQAMYEALLQGDDSLIMRDELRKRFADKLGDIDPKFIDFRANLAKPPTFEVGKKNGEKPIRVRIKGGNGPDEVMIISP